VVPLSPFKPLAHAALPDSQNTAKVTVKKKSYLLKKKWKEFYDNVKHSQWLTRNSHLYKLSLTAKGSSPVLWYIASNMMYTKTMPIQYKSDSTPVATKNCASDEKSPIKRKE